MKMKTYTVTYVTGAVQQEMHLPTPDRLVQAGDVYELTHRVLVTLGGHVYEQGERFEVIDRTEDAPHFRTSTLGNLLIRTRYGESVWTEFDAGVADGRFKLLESGAKKDVAIPSRLDRLLEDDLV